jgi:hypothetical protein
VPNYPKTGGKPPPFSFLFLLTKFLICYKLYKTTKRCFNENARHKRQYFIFARYSGIFSFFYICFSFYAPPIANYKYQIVNIFFEKFSHKGTKITKARRRGKRGCCMNVRGYKEEKKEK